MVTDENRQRSANQVYDDCHAGSGNQGGNQSPWASMGGLNLLKRVVEITRFIFPAHEIPEGNLGLAAPVVFVEGNVELLDQIGAVPLDKPGDVFSKMSAGLGLIKCYTVSSSI
jgi:hypothetical protein